ncbi:MAG: hypothetical protein ACUVUB_06760 [Candidatus Bathyarchaeia archaeon]
MSRTGIVSLIMLMLPICLQPMLSFASQAKPNPQGEVVFTEVILSREKIYDGEDVILTFTVRNLNSSDENFYIRIYRQEELIFDGKTNPFECVKGASTGRIHLPIAGWVGPGTYAVTVQLLSAVSDTVLDSRHFTLTVVKLIASNWTTSVSKATWGLNETLPLRINFTNTGNDDMFDAVITVMKSDLKISPLSSGNIGKVAIFETKTVTFTLGSLNKREIKPGTYKISLRLLFNDFRGVAHSHDETLEFTLERMKLKVSLSTTPTNPKYGEAIRFKLKLTDIIGKPLPDEQLTLQVGLTVMRNLTDRYGEATYNYSGLLDSGESEVKTIYGGSEYYMNLTEVFRVKIDPLATILIMKTPRILNATIPANFTLTLLDERRSPLRGQVLEVLLKSQAGNFYTKMTESEGEAYLTLNFDRSGEAELNVKYAGSRNYLKSSNSSTLIVNRASTKLGVYSNQTIIFTGKVVGFEIALRDLLDRPIKNVPVKITCDSEESIVSTTDLGGSVKRSLELKTPILYEIVRVRAVFSGDEVYAPSKGEIEILNVNLLTLIVLGSVVIGGAIFVLLNIARRRVAEKVRPLPKTKPLKSKRTTPELKEPLTPLDEKVYDYIVEHSGVISWSKASKDLGVTVEQLKESAQRLKEAGRIMPSSE